MTLGKHTYTPGPWEVYIGPISMDEGLNPFYRGIVALLKTSREGRDVAVIIPDRGMYFGPLDHEADAHLIAAAPDLLEALTLIRDMPSPLRSSASIALRMRAVAAKAIAKAVQS